MSGGLSGAQTFLSSCLRRHSCDYRFRSACRADQIQHIFDFQRRHHRTYLPDCCPLTWGGGLIAQISIGDAVYSDFAGSTIVHSVGGWLALVGR